MSAVDEALAADTPMAAALAQGIGTLSLNDTVTFTRYVRLVLPLDGFVFWVRSDLVSKGALYNAMGFNAANFNRSEHDPPEYVLGGGIGQFITGVTPIGGTIEGDGYTIVAQGSLHHAITRKQDETEDFEVNTVVFTSLNQVDAFNEIGPNIIYIGEYDGIRFAFSKRGPFYTQAELYHYVGDAIYPIMESQIIDSIAQLKGTKSVVSNSLPIWLAMNNYQPQPWEIYGNSIPLYSSYLVPDNIEPTYGVVHIEPGSTQAIASAPFLTRHSSHWQLSQDRAEITLYGVRNDQALDFIDFVNQQSVNYAAFGIRNIPIVRDQKRPQTELGVIAQKKTISYEITYYQHRANTIARQLIKQAIPTYYFSEA